MSCLECSKFFYGMYQYLLPQRGIRVCIEQPIENSLIIHDLHREPMASTGEICHQSERQQKTSLYINTKLGGGVAPVWRSRIEIVFWLFDSTAGSRILDGSFLRGAVNAKARGLTCCVTLPLSRNFRQRP
jgi:hypothetical protein